jgi:hypothetical protein
MHGRAIFPTKLKYAPDRVTPLLEPQLLLMEIKIKSKLPACINSPGCFGLQAYLVPFSTLLLIGLLVCRPQWASFWQRAFVLDKSWVWVLLPHCFWSSFRHLNVSLSEGQFSLHPIRSNRFSYTAFLIPVSAPCVWLSYHIIHHDL